MKVMYRIGVVLAVVAALASLPASAICGLADNRTFVSYSYYDGFVGGSANLVGSFWIVGSPGINSGTLPPSTWVAECTAGSPCSLGPNGSIFLAKDWAYDPIINGCPPASPALPKMAFQFTGPIAGGGTGFGAGCATPDPGNGNYTFSASGGQVINVGVIPKVAVTSSSRAPNQVTVGIAAPPLPGGVLDEASCGVAPSTYRVYSQTVARGGAAPTDRLRSAGWAQQGANNPSSLTLPCVGNQDIYLAYSVIFSDGVESLSLGPNSTVVQCGSTSADQPNDFKIIKKPIRKPTSAQ